MTIEVIPPNIWLFIKEFVDSKVTGEIVLYMKDGVILSAHFGQNVRAVRQ